MSVTGAGPHVYPELRLSPQWANPAALALKRVFDIVLSAVAVALLSPVLLVLAVAVKLGSEGPVLYRWRVVGRDGRPFTGFKFRSMYVNADGLRDKLEHRNEMTGPVFKIANDPRITTVGRWMRKYSLDELPQLFSVLKGDMSLVGPRPPLETEFARFNDFQKQKLAVKPGISCLWQVSGRNEIKDFDEWLRLDLQYIATWSFALDLKICVLTIREMLAGSGR
jgi:lipopolysaccharide/colanic/teichoic acid biosynthesis glycosyltransferase